MGRAETRGVASRPSAVLARVRVHAILAIAAVVFIACVGIASMLFSRAAAESRAIRDRTLAATVSLSFALDLEVESALSLLKGLSQSPALKLGDFKQFYDQLKATPVPEGAWFILWDLDRQLLNTLRPFDAELPKIADFASRAEAIERMKTKGFTVSGRIVAPVAKITIVVLSLRLNAPDGEMNGILTTAIPEKSLKKILDGLSTDPSRTQLVLDRKLQTIIRSGGSYEAAEPPPSKALRTRLGGVESGHNAEGFLEDTDLQGTRLLLAYRHSGLTDWTTVSEVPKAILDAPTYRVFEEIGLTALALVILGGAAAIFLARQFEAPLRALTNSVSETQRALRDVSGELLSTQDEERGRIARELHDSTAQHLVAASINLVRLSKSVKENGEALARCEELDQLLDQALKELRVFTYLLYPPDLASGGLSSTVTIFVEGFCQRTGIVPRLQTLNYLDDLPLDIQHACLRVVQESLANVYRHAAASGISVVFRMAGRFLVLRIGDNGRGIARSYPEDRPKLGVGIPGMRTRLQQFGGHLKIKTGSWGTVLIASIPTGKRSASPRSKAWRTSGSLSTLTSVSTDTIP